MTRILGVLAAAIAGVWLPGVAAAQQAGDLTLRDVIELHRSGLGDDLLIAVIDTDGGPFRLGFNDIHDLKSDGLSERVIEALVRTGREVPGRVEDALSSSPVPSVAAEEAAPWFIPAIVVPVPVPVVVWDAGAEGRHAHEPSRRASRNARGGTREPATPPAAWVTRASDGRNMPLGRGDRRGVAPAAWVTPREPKPPVKPDSRP